MLLGIRSNRRTYTASKRFRDASCGPWRGWSMLYPHPRGTKVGGHQAHSARMVSTILGALSWRWMSPAVPGLLVLAREVDQ